MAIDSNLERAFKRITSAYATATRPVLQCIQIRQGTAFATDSHRALLFKEFSQDKTLSMLLNLNTFTVDDESNYPETRQLMKVEGLVSFELNHLQAEQLQVFCKMIVKLSLDQPIIAIDVIGNCINVSSNQRKDDKTETSISLYVNHVAYLKQYKEDEEFNLSCDARYLMQALEYFTNIKGAWAEPLLFKFDFELKPFMISNEISDYLLTPVRVF